jgi:16S rRNA (adenine1518-N6/adenine1519-N6)-dimethyltransferase
VLRLEFAPRFRELGVDAAGFDTFLHRCFAQKRKTLANNLRAAAPSGARGYSIDELHAVWPAEIPPLARAESLALEPLAALYRALAPLHQNEE